MERTSTMEIPAGAQMVVKVEVLQGMFMRMHELGLFVPGALPRIAEVINEAAVLMKSTPSDAVPQLPEALPGGSSNGPPSTSGKSEASSGMPVRSETSSSASSSDVDTITSQRSGLEEGGRFGFSVKRRRGSRATKSKRAALALSDDDEDSSPEMDISENSVAQSSGIPAAKPNLVTAQSGESPAAKPILVQAPIEPVPTAGTSNSVAASKAEKVPPIFVRDKAKWSMAISALRSSGVDIKSAQNKNDAVVVRVSDGNSFRAATKILADKGVGFHSYSFGAEKEVRVVIRGIPEHVPTDDIKAELAELGIVPSVAHRMVRRRDNKPLPLVFITAPIQQADKLYQLSSISYCRVRVEKAHKRQGAPQCHRCQGFYHVAKNCHMNPTCVRCAGDHLTAQCTLAKDAPLKCANCKLNHTANYRGCNAFPKLPIKRTTQRAVLPPHRSAHTAISSGRSFAQAAANRSEITRPNAGTSGVSAASRPSGAPTQQARISVSGNSAANASTLEASASPTSTLAGIFAILSTLDMNNVERQIASTLAGIRAAKSDEERKLRLINGIFRALK